MLSDDSGLPEKRSVLKNLSGLEREIFQLVLESWPTSTLEIAENFNEDLSSRKARRKASTKYAYYLKKLVEKQLILSKRVGNALIVWPLRVEKFRMIQNVLGEEQ